MPRFVSLDRGPRRHGIIIRASRSGNQLSVSCLCRAVMGRGSNRNREDYHEPMDNVEGESLYDVYNNPENHWADFDKHKDRIG